MELNFPEVLRSVHPIRSLCNYIKEIIKFKRSKERFSNHFCSPEFIDVTLGPFNMIVKRFTEFAQEVPIAVDLIGLLNAIGSFHQLCHVFVDEVRHHSFDYRCACSTNEVIFVGQIGQRKCN